MDLSIVTTLYRSEPYIEEFCNRIGETASKIAANYEVILVNDGSPDHSLELAVDLYERDPRVRVVDLSRNFGHHKAMMTGLRHARGRLVFLIDCDLEIKPEVLLEFHDKLRTTDVDVVYGVQDVRKGERLDRLVGQFFYTVFNWLSTHPLPPELCMVRLMTRRYVDALVAHEEREVLIGGLWLITGFAQIPILVSKQWKGSTTYNLGRKLGLLINGVTSFSSKPLLLIFYLGCIVSMLAVVAALYLIVRSVFFGGFLVGWGSVMVSIMLLGGLNMLSLGIVGVYLTKIFIETKQRPYTIVRDLYQHDRAD